MRRVSRNTALYAYLEKAGLLEKGSEAEILAAKKQFRKEYLKEYKKEKHRKGLLIVISLSEPERKRLLKESGKHQLRLPTYIRRSALAYTDSEYLIVDRIRVVHIEELLMKCEQEIQAIAKGEGKRWFGTPEWKFEALEAKIQLLERDIIQALRYPDTVEKIVAHIKENPELKASLLLKLTYDRKDKIPENDEPQAAS